MWEESNDLGKLRRKLNKVLSNARNKFEKICKAEIFTAVMKEYGGWPKIPVSVQTHVENWERGENWGTARKAVVVEHIDGVYLGDFRECGRDLMVVLTPNGLLKCERARLETNGPLGGNTIPQWKAERRGREMDGAPKEIGFYEFFTNSGQNDVDGIFLHAGKYDPDLERQIIEEIEERDLEMGYQDDNWAKLRRSGKTAEELDTYPESWMQG